MPKLVKNGDPDVHDVESAVTIVAEAEWDAASGAGLLLSADAEPTAEHAKAPLIAIDFPVFNDGRGLSLAVLLRTRFGYKGEVRAVGDVHPDILHYMRRCGFDSYEIPDGRDPQTAVAALAPYADYYQASAVEPQPSYRRIRRGA